MALVVPGEQCLDTASLPKVSTAQPHARPWPDRGGTVPAFHEPTMWWLALQTNIPEAVE